MSTETRSSSALLKRAEQLKRWEESDTNREPVAPKRKIRRIKFSSGCVFLAACAAGDKDEVIKLLENGADINTANVDGLTALHQACIDDNLDMVEFLVEHGADVNRGDNEGWTPLHATASCGFLYIAKYLIEKGANVAAVNNDGELPLDIAVTECQKMEDLLKEEIQKRGIDCEAARNEEEMIMLRDAKDWLATKSSLVNTPHPKTGATPLHVASAKGYVDVIKILLQCGADIDAQDVDGWSPLHAAAHWGQKEVCQLLVENLADMDSKNFVGQTAFDLADSDMLSYLEDLRKKQNKEDVFLRRSQAKKRQDPLESETPSKVKKVEMIVENDSKSNEISEKKNRVNAEPEAIKKPSVTPKIIENLEENQSWRQPPLKSNNQDLVNPVKSSVSNNLGNTSESINENEVTIRRPTSLQNDKEPAKNENRKNLNISTATTANVNVSPDKTSPVSSPQPNNHHPFRRSFVPPSRDEESETQRKAHAKRVRETRRSTQGVTLEEIKSAEQFVKSSEQFKKNNNNNPTITTSTSTSTTTTNETPGSNGDSPNGVVVTATITTATPTVKTTRETEDAPIAHERRPSWRLRLDNGTSKFKLEDASKPLESANPAPFIRRTNISSVPSQRPSSAPAPLETADTTITLPLRRPKTMEDKAAAEHDKENDMRNAQATLATQAAIQRRRRPKRRSTGVVSFENVDDMDKENDSSGKDCDDVMKVNHIESGPDRSSRSRISSTSDIRNENGEIDYKKLYEQQLAENDRLKEKLRKSEEELRETKQTLEKINVVTSKNSLSELEKREKRAMERKLSEMEEELKQLQKLKAENERLKADNRSLTRVINKLTNAPKP